MYFSSSSNPIKKRMSEVWSESQPLWQQIMGGGIGGLGLLGGMGGFGSNGWLYGTGSSGSGLFNNLFSR